MSFWKLKGDWQNGYVKFWIIIILSLLSLFIKVDKESTWCPHIYYWMHYNSLYSDESTPCCSTSLLTRSPAPAASQNGVKSCNSHNTNHFIMSFIIFNLLIPHICSLSIIIWSLLWWTLCIARSHASSWKLEDRNFDTEVLADKKYSFYSWFTVPFWASKQAGKH